MPSSPLDGLNKPFGHGAVTYYRQYFNSLAKKQCGIEIAWDRGYICQVARFDPSKGEPFHRGHILFRSEQMTD